MTVCRATILRPVERARCARGFLKTTTRGGVPPSKFSRKKTRSTHEGEVDECVTSDVKSETYSCSANFGLREGRTACCMEGADRTGFSTPRGTARMSRERTTHTKWQRMRRTQIQKLGSQNYVSLGEITKHGGSELFTVTTSVPLILIPTDTCGHCENAAQKRTVARSRYRRPPTTDEHIPPGRPRSPLVGYPRRRR